MIQSSNPNPLPTVDNKTVFGHNYQEFVTDNLLPIGSTLVTALPPTMSTMVVFTVWSYEVIGHSVYVLREDGPYAGTANSLRPLETWEFTPSVVIFFMGKSWFLPPRSLEPFLTQEYQDLFKVIDAGLVTVPDEYRKIANSTTS